jgi:aminoglycoside phosphotransferase (APT) family kinase protein
MFLTRANVLHYLVERQFVDPETAVSGAFTVRSLMRRNASFHVTGGAREYLVKQSKQWDAEARGSIEREAAFYRRQETANLPSPLAPRCYSYDPPNSVLILEFLSGHTDLLNASDRFAPQVGRMVGETMAAFHLEKQSGNPASEFPGSIPWVLSLHQIAKDITEPSGGQRELVRAVKRHAEFAAALDRLRAEWRNDALLHGDWKLDNCLVPPDRERLRVVDWEFAFWGDSVWDVSSLLQAYWNFWVRWPSQYPIESIQPALRAFLEAYAHRRGVDPGELAARAIRFAGARMLQTAFEILDKVEQITPGAVRLLQGSLHILTRPDWAAEQLLGTPLRSLHKMSATCIGN